MGEDATKRSAADEAGAGRLLSTEELFEGLDKLYESIPPDDAPAAAPEPGQTLKADSTLPHSTHFEITESGDAFNVRAEIPPASAPDLGLAEVQRHLSLRARPLTSSADPSPKTGSRRRKADPILRAIDLLADADRENVTATLTGGTLEMKLPKGRVKAVTSAI